MTREELIEGLKLLEDNMVYFDELLNDKGKWIDVHELLFESIEALEQEPCEDCDYKEWLKGEAEPKTDVLDKIRAELHATAEMHEDGDYYLRDEWIDEIFDDYKAESEEKE